MITPARRRQFTLLALLAAATVMGVAALTAWRYGPGERSTRFGDGEHYWGYWLAEINGRRLITDDGTG